MPGQTPGSIFIDGREHAFAGSEDGADGTSHAVQVGPGHWHAVIRGRSVEIVMNPETAGEPFADGVPTKFHVDGLEVMVQVEDARARISREAQAKRQSTGPVTVTINAPMPGRVVSIAVEVGMTVGRGDVIAVLEAMKMESAIIATHSGIIREVLIEAGQPVTTRQALVRISG